MLYCCDCKYYNKEKEHFEEKRIFYTKEKYDIKYEQLGWCNKNNCEAIPAYPMEYCETITQEHIDNEINFYLEYYGEFYE